MAELVYGRFTAEALDREYNNRAQRPGAGFDAFVAQCQQQSEAARTGLKCAIDVAFGPDPEERLDIFMPANARNAPVNIFFHGGFWRASTKEDFSYVALGSVPEGYVTVVVNYGLIPSITMAALIDQCRRALAWTHANVGDHGGDPAKLCLSGHSAGGHIVAMLMATRWDWLPARPFRAACAISGIYELEPVRRSFLNRTLALGDDEVAAFSPIALAPQVRCPLLCAVGGVESSEFLRQNREFADAWRARGVPTETMVLPGKDHFGIREDLGTPQGAMNRAMLDHFRRALDT